MKRHFRNLFFFLLILALVSLVRIYTSDPDYAPVAKAVEDGDSTARHDLEIFFQEHRGEERAEVFYNVMLGQLHLCAGETISLDSAEMWSAQAQASGDSLLYAKSLNLLAECHAAQGNLAQAKSIHQRADKVTEQTYIAKAAHNRKIIAVIALALCVVAALGMTFLHFYRRETTAHRYAKRRLAQAKEQLAMTAQHSDSLLASIQQMRSTMTPPDASPADNDEKIDKEVCAFRTQQIVLTLTSLLYSDITERFRKSATDRRVHITSKDWSALTEQFSQQLPQLIALLQSNQTVTLSERRVCLLTLLDMGTLETASILGLQNSSVSSAKKTLIEKLTGDGSASAKDLKTKIISLIATA